MRIFSRLKIVSLAFSLAFFSCLATIISVLPAAAQAPQGWSDITHGSVVSNGETISADDYRTLLSQNNSIIGKLACEKQSVDMSPGVTDDQDCWYSTSIGLIMQGGGTVWLKGQPYAGYVDDGNSQLFPTPNPDLFVQLTTDNSTGLYHVYFRTAADCAMSLAAVNIGAPSFYDFDKLPTHELVNSAGQPWELDDNEVYSQIAYSNNGRWMVVWDGQGIVTRVDLQNFTARDIPVEDAADASSDYALMTISDDGHFLVVADQGRFLRMYGVDTCIGIDNFCESYRDLGANLNFFNRLSPQYVFGGVPRFISDDLLSFYTFNPTNGPGDYYQYYFRAPNTQQTNYIALGDSYASGEGEGSTTFYPETDVRGVNMCHLSRQSYPFLIGKRLSLDSTHSVACSGAKTTNIANGSGVDKTLSRPDRDNQYYNPNFDYRLSWTPGYVGQLNYITKNKPGIITISAVGNDIGFSNIIKRCLAPDTCYASYEDRLELVRLIDNQFDKLVGLYTDIKQATVPDARIYVIGYPSIVKSDGECGGNVRLNGKETVFANDLVSYLDSVIRRAADKAGVYFVSDQTVFNGHRLCNGTHAERAMNGLMIGHDTVTLPIIHKAILSSGSFHPTQYGHQLLAAWIEQMTDDFSNPMPRADDTIAEPSEADALAGPLLDAPKTGRPIYSVNYDNNLSNDVVFYYGVYGEEVAPTRSTLTGLLPLSSAHFWLHSSPVDLGEYKADVNGNLAASLKIPSSVPPGFHTLMVHATSADGQPVEFTKTVYVAASPDDYDGDGVPNSQEPCLIFEVPAGQTQGADYSCEEAEVPTSAANTDTQSVTGSAATTDSSSFSPVSARRSIAPAIGGQEGRAFNTGAQNIANSTKKNLPHSSTAVRWLWLGASLALLIILTFLLRVRYAKN